MQKVKIIGAGLAGADAAKYLADHGVKVELYDCKPKVFSPAHDSPNFGELVCSNSLKSADIYGNAAGLLKEEMRRLGSLVMEAADSTKVPAGGALAVDREKFSAYITAKLKSHENITVISEEVAEIPEGFSIIATGPLTVGKLNESIRNTVGGDLHFYDASAPIVTAESIDMNNAFISDRYDRGSGDHINCPMNKEQYTEFIEKLLSAERAELHNFEKLGEENADNDTRQRNVIDDEQSKSNSIEEKTTVFEGCMPVEIMAERGRDTLRFGPLKPAGLTDPSTGRWPYACLQLRKEDEGGNLYNLVGFQTNLKWGEQKRVFSVIPALRNAEYIRYGVMHRNTFINSPECLNMDYSLKNRPKTFFAGQITGVEGYVESAGSGLLSAIYLERKLKGLPEIFISDKTVSGALVKYITTKNKDFQPMNANFGILPPISIIRDKAERKRAQAERSLAEVDLFIKEITK